MQEKKFYSLPAVPFEYNALEPVISEEQLSLHYERHHKAYVDAANKILTKLDEAKEKGLELDYKATLKSLSFNIGGHLLHSLFWGNLASPNKRNEEEIGENLKLTLIEEFGSIEGFKKAFAETAVSVEGSGWAALTFCKLTRRPMLMQVEKHNVNVYPAFQIILVLDVWEHAYYLDYKNDRKSFIESFWEIVNWKEVTRRFNESQVG